MCVITLLFISIFLFFDSVLGSGAKMSPLYAAENVHTMFSGNFVVPERELLKVDLLYTVDSEYKQYSGLQSICTETCLVTASLMLPMQSLQVTLEIILLSVLLQFTRISTYAWEGNNLIYCKPPHQSSSSEVVQKLARLQPSVRGICDI